MTTRILLAGCILALCVGTAQGQDWAQRMFHTTSHNFGTVARGAKAEFAFELQNLHGQDVHIASVRSSCGCTSPSVTKRLLKPQDKSQIVAKYNTHAFLGAKSATITVVFDRPQYAEVQLSVQGYIRSDVVFDPGEVNFGQVDYASVAEKTVRVNYAGRPDWKIVDVRSANRHLEVELVETERSQQRVSYEMLVRLKPDAPAGYLQGQLSIISDDSRLQKIPLEIQGRVVSPLTVSPASLFLGVLKPGQMVTKQLVVRGKRPFTVVSVECEDDCFEFREPEKTKKTIHLIPVNFTAGESPGNLSETIRIRTDLGVAASCVASATIKEDAQKE